MNLFSAGEYLICLLGLRVLKSSFLYFLTLFFTTPSMFLKIMGTMARLVNTQGLCYTLDHVIKDKVTQIEFLSFVYLALAWRIFPHYFSEEDSWIY